MESSSSAGRAGRRLQQGVSEAPRMSSVTIVGLIAGILVGLAAFALIYLRWRRARAQQPAVDEELASPTPPRPQPAPATASPAGAPPRAPPSLSVEVPGDDAPSTVSPAKSTATPQKLRRPTEASPSSAAARRATTPPVRRSPADTPPQPPLQRRASAPSVPAAGAGRQRRRSFSGDLAAAFNPHERRSSRERRAGRGDRRRAPLRRVARPKSRGGEAPAGGAGGGAGGAPKMRASETLSARRRPPREEAELREFARRNSAGSVPSHRTSAAAGGAAGDGRRRGGRRRRRRGATPHATGFGAAMHRHSSAPANDARHSAARADARRDDAGAARRLLRRCRARRRRGRRRRRRRQAVDAGDQHAMLRATKAGAAKEEAAARSCASPRAGWPAVDGAHRRRRLRDDAECAPLYGRLQRRRPAPRLRAQGGRRGVAQEGVPPARDAAPPGPPPALGAGRAGAGREIFKLISSKYQQESDRLLSV